MRKGDWVEMAHKSYWKYALWIIAGISLLALFAINTFLPEVKVEHIVVSVVFSLVFCAWFSAILRKMLMAKGNPKLPFLVYTTMRALMAIAVVGGYMAYTGVRGRGLLVFALLFSVYFILLDVLDAVFMLKVFKTLQQET